MGRGHPDGRGPLSLHVLMSLLSRGRLLSAERVHHARGTPYSGAGGGMRVPERRRRHARSQADETATPPTTAAIHHQSPRSSHRASTRPTAAATTAGNHQSLRRVAAPQLPPSPAKRLRRAQVSTRNHHSETAPVAHCQPSAANAFAASDPAGARASRRTPQSATMTLPRATSARSILHPLGALRHLRYE